MNMKTKTLSIGIASFESFKARTLSIARGEYKPKKGEPKIWFSSIESLAQVLSTKNQMLLEIIATQNPSSITELAELSGREKGNLSRTLKTMENFGLVELKPGDGRELIPYAPYRHFKVECGVFNNIELY
jgi:predicted transcriptional regulator